MKVLTLYDKSGPKYHRCLLPCFLMDGIKLIVNHSLLESQLEGVDVVFINRLIWNETIENVEKLRDKYGFKLVVDNDDHWKLDPDHQLIDIYERGRAREGIEEYMRIADAVTVTHERLAVEARKFSDNVFVLPNSIPYFGQFAVQKIDSPFTRLFWAGSSTHTKDIELLRNPIKRFNLPVMMVMGGFADNPAYKQMATAFTNGAKMRHQLIKALPVDEYYQSYSLCDISLIPLRDTKFNQYKSNLKILEAANILAPVIVSRVHPYLDFPEELVNYVDDQRDWYDHVKMLVNQPDYAKNQGLLLNKYCSENFNFGKINQQRKEIFYAVTGK